MNNLNMLQIDLMNSGRFRANRGFLVHGVPKSSSHWTPLRRCGWASGQWRR